MADPISIIGTVGALANIIDAVNKAIGTISELRNQWKEADLTFQPYRAACGSPGSI